MNKTMYLDYTSSFDKIVELNSSFDFATLKVAYHGLNRNNSFIAKETFENNIKSMFNCPVVTNYKRDIIDENGNNGDFGSHDSHLEIEKDEKGKIISIDYINDTYPIGVIPESANYWWEDIEDNSGVHQYLCTNVILWKRQDAYNKLKMEKVFNHSMEIEVIDGNFSDLGYYEIKNFQFTAFCILSNSVEPCFESSQIELFNKSNFKEQFTEMLKELKDFSLQNQNSSEVDNIKDFKKEGEDMPDINEEVITEVVEEITEEIIVTEPVATEDLAEEDNAENFELSHDDVRDRLHDIINPLDADGYHTWNYWIMEVFQTYFMISDEKNADTYYKVNYSIDGETISVDLENKTQMYLTWLTLEEKNQIETDKQSFEALKTEVEDLKSYKLDIETKEKEEFARLESERKTELVEKFSKVLTKEIIESFNVVELSFDELENNLKIAYANIDLETKFSLNSQKDSNKIVVMNDNSETINTSSPYGEAGKKYLPKK